MPRVNHTTLVRRWPATGLMTVGVAAMITYAVWLSTQRSARVDDRLPSDHWPDMRFNINAASAAELALLPGLGERLAQRIVEYRELNGEFLTLEDVQRVPGIGAATVQRFAAYVTVDSASTNTTHP